jgi:NAD+ diphosphatase
MFVPSVSPSHEHERRTWLIVHPKGLVARKVEGQVVFPTDEEVAALGIRATDAQRLGTLDGTDVVTAPFERRVEAPFDLLGLRALAGALAPQLFGVVGRAMHTCDWLTSSRFCGRCGTPTTRVESERCMACPSCALRVYPRISPAIITLVRKGDLALLASNAKFPGVFYSALAGFAEIGESLEETLSREVQEEVGITVTNVRYFGSQPWPFPSSLMIAFTADWSSGEIVIDPSELSDAKWFSADALPMLPPPLSIARTLIEAWLAEVVAP